MAKEIRVTPRALADTKRIQTWWRRHREAAPDLFGEELEAVLARALLTPYLGIVDEEEHLDVTVRRVLMPRTRAPAVRCTRRLVSRACRPVGMRAGDPKLACGIVV
jgi:plasmid stabilization system protein ParE